MEELNPHPGQPKEGIVIGVTRDNLIKIEGRVTIGEREITKNSEMNPGKLNRFNANQAVRERICGRDQVITRWKGTRRKILNTW